MAKLGFNTHEIIDATGDITTNLNGSLELTPNIKDIDPSNIISASYTTYAAGTEQVFTFTLNATSTTAGTVHTITFDTDEDDLGQAKKYSFTHVALAGALTTALIIDALDAKIQAHQDYSKFPFVVTNTNTTLVLTASSTKVSGRIAGEFGVLAGSYSDDSGAITENGTPAGASRVKPVGHPTVMKRLADATGVRFLGTPGTAGSAKYSEISIKHKTSSTSGAPHGAELVKVDTMYLLQADPSSLTAEEQKIQACLAGAISAAAPSSTGLDLGDNFQVAMTGAVLGGGSKAFGNTFRYGMNNAFVTSTASSKEVYIDNDTFAIGDIVVLSIGDNGVEVNASTASGTSNIATAETMAAAYVVAADTTNVFQKLTGKNWQLVSKFTS